MDLKQRQEIAQKYLVDLEKYSLYLRKGNITDETCELLEYRMLQMRTELKTIFESFALPTQPVTEVTVKPENEDQKLLNGLKLLQLKLNHL